MRFAPELQAPEPPKRDADEVAERIFDRSAERHIRRPIRPPKAARSGAPPDAAPGAMAPIPAALVLDGPRGSAHRRQMVALGLLGASPAMRVRQLSLREEPEGVISRESD